MYMYYTCTLTTLVGYTALDGKGSRDVRSEYFLSIVFLVAGQ